MTLPGWQNEMASFRSRAADGGHYESTNPAARATPRTVRWVPIWPGTGRTGVRNCPDCDAELQVALVNGAETMRCPWTLVSEAANATRPVWACGRAYYRAHGAG